MANTLNLGNGDWATKEDLLLGYNNENAAYKPLPFNFTRASSGTVVNRQGLIETVQSGIPRIDFLGNTKGALLLEPQRTNLITYSSDFSQWTFKTGISVSSNEIISVDGTLNGSKIETTANGSRYVGNNYTLSNGNNTFSVFAKKGVNNWIYLNVLQDGSNNWNYTFDLENGLIGQSNASAYTVTPKIEDYGNGWYRCSIIANVTSSGVFTARIYPADSSTDVSTIVGSNVYIYGAQLEASSYPTSYIPTQGSTVTRVQDACSQTPPSGVIGQTEGTMFFEIDFANTSGVAGAWSISSGSSANRITMNTLGFSLTQFTLSVAQNYNSSSTKLASTNVTYSDNHKVAIKYSATTLKLFVDGQLADSVATDGFGNYTKFYLGGNQVGVGGDARKFIQADLYNTALTDAELQALTTI